MRARTSLCLHCKHTWTINDLHIHAPGATGTIWAYKVDLVRLKMTPWSRIAGITTLFSPYDAQSHSVSLLLLLLLLLAYSHIAIVCGLPSTTGGPQSVCKSVSSAYLASQRNQAQEPNFNGIDNVWYWLTLSSRCQGGRTYSMTLS